MDAIPAGTSSMDQYASVISQLLSLSGEPDCSSWNIADDTNPDQSYRPTFYLDCSSFGQFETGGTGPTSIVSSNLNVAWYLSTCYEVFGVPVSPDTDTVNIVYGSTRPWGSNYAFVSSLSDPYQSLQVNQTSLLASQVFYVETLGTLLPFLPSSLPPFFLSLLPFSSFFLPFSSSSSSPSPFSFPLPFLPSPSLRYHPLILSSPLLLTKIVQIQYSILYRDQALARM